MSLGKIYTIFANQITNLQTTAGNVSDAINGIAQRMWRIPKGWTGDTFDIKNIAMPFMRSEINDVYPDIYLKSEGTEADAAAAKWQASHLGGQERAFRLQMQSGIRCSMHAAARRKGQSDSGNGSFARIQDHVLDMITAGSS